MPAFNEGETDFQTQEGPGRPANPRLYKREIEIEIATRQVDEVFVPWAPDSVLGLVR